ncbi:Gfo/Idh/MocA family oxidoreductase [Chitiniphilus purpureus]|uniref:Gfo/Idh/MocA family oxidoreductase n=1 Tax=Chitiniphilus purpureus TaxID=2981137 RepID=A0ABY6DRJ7_9NEIS|nr:Gfo/Idh/MocA family oxidoreductase [Chitiniphilus sp. CD1]UXY16981.1 Gfo/Idh/MocA family oxidoreductase [Chitiniphilus sp. CD1]
MQPTIRLGLIGCGVAARELHWPALLQVRDVLQLVAVCNRTPEKAQALASLAGGIDWYRDWEALIARDDIAAVDIVLPATLNLAATRAALAADKHVLVEKPLAATLEEAQAMRALARAHPGKVLLVAENFRYAWFLQRLRQWLASGEVGRPYALHWHAFSHMTPDNRYIASGWRGSEAFPGGLLLDAGVHYIAVVRALLGEITAAQLDAVQVNPALGRYDGGCLHFETADGAHGSLNLYFSVPGHNEWRLVLLAERGTAQYDGRTLTLHHADGRVVSETRPDDDGYAAELRAFAEAIARGAGGSDFDEAWRDMRVIGETMAQPGRRVLLD